jgi:hypothetical protein
MSHIFLSHSSTNNAEAVALRDWLAGNGWKDEIFLDLDPQRGIAAGERWERALHEAASRCEAVLFLVSKAWLASVWCRKELNLAHHLNKRLFGVLIEDLPVGDLPEDLTGNWQIVRLAAGRDHMVLRAVLPITHEEAHVHFSAEGLQRNLTTTARTASGQKPKLPRCSTAVGFTSISGHYARARSSVPVQGVSHSTCMRSSTQRRPTHSSLWLAD